MGGTKAYKGVLEVQRADGQQEQGLLDGGTKN